MKIFSIFEWIPRNFLENFSQFLKEFGKNSRSFYKNFIQFLEEFYSISK